MIKAEEFGESWRKYFVLMALWGSILLLVALSASYISLSKFLVDLVNSPVHVHAVLLVPGVLAGICCFWGPLMQALREGQDTNLKYGVGIPSLVLIFYCLYLVLATGGVPHSALTSAVAVVILLSAPILGKARIYVLAWSFLGTLCVTMLSLLSVRLSIPERYPDGWTEAGSGDTLVAAMLIVLTPGLEWLIARLRSGLILGTRSSSALTLALPGGNYIPSQAEYPGGQGPEAGTQPGGR